MTLICERCFNQIRSGELYLRLPRVRYRSSNGEFDRVYVYKHADADEFVLCPAPSGRSPFEDRDDPVPTGPTTAIPPHRRISWRLWPRELPI